MEAITIILNDIPIYLELSFSLIFTIIGAILGIIITLWFIPKYFPPRIKISNKVAIERKGKKTTQYRIKMVNRTKFPIIDVSADLHFIYRHPIKDINVSRKLELIRSHIILLPKYNEKDENHDYAYRFLVKKGQKDILELFDKHKDDNPVLRFRISAKHERSGYTKPFSKEYSKEDCLFGDFEVGKAMNIRIVDE